MKSHAVKKLVLGSLTLAGALVVFAMVDGTASAEDPACHRTEFKTKLVKEACAKGGQKAAATAMKKFLKDIKNAKKADGDKISITCKTCHGELKPEFPLKKEGLKLFNEYSEYLKTKK